jgi:hypothetical protein
MSRKPALAISHRGVIAEIDGWYLDASTHFTPSGPTVARMSSSCRDVEALSRMQHNVTVAHVKCHVALHAVQDLVVIVGMCFIEIVGVVMTLGFAMTEQEKQAVPDPAELGRPIAYLALKDGTTVYDRTGQRVGVLDHVVVDDPTDIFEGLIVHTLPLPGRHLFADRSQIAALHERGVLLSADRDELHDPSLKSTRHTDPDHPVESPLQSRLRHAWDWISGQL